MHRTVWGIPFIIESPSLWHLNTSFNDSQISAAHLRFDGATWRLFVAMSDGRQHARVFESRDAALWAMGGRRAA